MTGEEAAAASVLTMGGDIAADEEEETSDPEMGRWRERGLRSPLDRPFTRLPPPVEQSAVDRRSCGLTGVLEARRRAGLFLLPLPPRAWL